MLLLCQEFDMINAIRLWDSLLADEKRFELVNGRLRLILHFNKWMTRLVNELKIHVDTALASDNYDEADRDEFVYQKAVKLLEKLKGRIEMKFIWDDRETKMFVEDDKWVDYKFCVDGDFVSKDTCCVYVPVETKIR